MWINVVKFVNQFRWLFILSDSFVCVSFSFCIDVVVQCTQTHFTTFKLMSDWSLLSNEELIFSIESICGRSDRRIGGSITYFVDLFSRKRRRNLVNQQLRAKQIDWNEECGSISFSRFIWFFLFILFAFRIKQRKYVWDLCDIFPRWVNIQRIVKWLPFIMLFLSFSLYYLCG